MQWTILILKYIENCTVWKIPLVSKGLTLPSQSLIYPGSFKNVDPDQLALKLTDQIPTVFQTVYRFMLIMESCRLIKQEFGKRVAQQIIQQCKD